MHHQDIKIAMIGLDTSHSVEFTRRLQAPACPENQRVTGMRVTHCCRFMTPFTTEAVLDERSSLLASWGVRVTDRFDEAIAGCDAIMLEINDPSLHLDYFRKCLDIDVPVFIDKPLADCYENGREIAGLASKHGKKVLSASALRCSGNLIEACSQVTDATHAYCYGPLGKALAGNSLIWYGVHSFEMLQRIMGKGALSVDARQDESGIVIVVQYPDNRRGIVELTHGLYLYGGTVKSSDAAVSFQVDTRLFYTELLQEIKQFFLKGKASWDLDDALEIIKMMDYSVASYEKNEAVRLDDW